MDWRFWLQLVFLYFYYWKRCFAEKCRHSYSPVCIMVLTTVLQFFFTGEVVVEEDLPSDLPGTFIQFKHHSYSQMVSMLKKTASKCSHIATTYSIGRSFEGKDLFVIEFSTKPGHHELRELYQCWSGCLREVQIIWVKTSLFNGISLKVWKTLIQKHFSSFAFLNWSDSWWFIVAITVLVQFHIFVTSIYDCGWHSLFLDVWPCTWLRWYGYYLCPAFKEAGIVLCYWPACPLYHLPLPQSPFIYHCTTKPYTLPISTVLLYSFTS